MAGKRGGCRPGAGRPETDNKRTMRGLKFTDYEWNAIRKIAEEQGISARAFLVSLVEYENATYGWRKERQTERTKEDSPPSAPEASKEFAQLAAGRNRRGKKSR